MPTDCLAAHLKSRLPSATDLALDISDEGWDVARHGDGLAQHLEGVDCRAGGRSNNPSKNWGDVWCSSDGKVWHELNSKAIWKPRHEHSAFVISLYLHRAQVGFQYQGRRLQCSQPVRNSVSAVDWRYGRARRLVDANATHAVNTTSPASGARPVAISGKS